MSNPSRDLPTATISGFMPVHQRHLPPPITITECKSETPEVLNPHFIPFCHASVAPPVPQIVSVAERVAIVTSMAESVVGNVGGLLNRNPPPLLQRLSPAHSPVMGSISLAPPPQHTPPPQQHTPPHQQQTVPPSQTTTPPPPAVVVAIPRGSPSPAPPTLSPTPPQRHLTPTLSPRPTGPTQHDTIYIKEEALTPATTALSSRPKPFPLSLEAMPISPLPIPSPTVNQPLKSAGFANMPTLPTAGPGHATQLGSLNTPIFLTSPMPGLGGAQRTPIMPIHFWSSLSPLASLSPHVSQGSAAQGAGGGNGGATHFQFPSPFLNGHMAAFSPSVSQLSTFSSFDNLQSPVFMSNSPSKPVTMQQA